MRTVLVGVAVATLVLALPGVGVARQTFLARAARDVTLADGSVLKVEAGELQVPESRRRPTSRMVTIPYYRLASTSSTPATPIFLLAGGPGSSGLDEVKEPGYAREVAFYRGIADVILFDQRGAGHARPAMTCTERAELSADQPFDADKWRASMRALLTSCRDRWLARGVDLAAYNTVESAADVNDLRRALGYTRVTLIGGSYGSHLALQVMRAYPEVVERAVLHAVEGPDHTWDSPSGVLKALERIASATERSTAFAGHVPPGGLLNVLAEAIARLEAAPRVVAVPGDSGSRQVVVDGEVVRRMARVRAGSRGTPNAWPEMILALGRGDLSMAARAALDIRRLRIADPMHYSMDCASGVSEPRRNAHREDPARALLGDINLEYDALCELWPTEDLGEAFRANVAADMPVLIMHGTWDVSTPIDNAREVAAALPRAHLIEVTGGTHSVLYNLFQRWPPMYRSLRGFLAGGPIDFPRQVDLMMHVTFQTPGSR